MHRSARSIGDEGTLVKKSSAFTVVQMEIAISLGVLY
jgi:hypothetical protein